MKQIERGKPLLIPPEVRRAIVREIKLQLLRKLREAGRITEGDYDRLSPGYRGGDEWNS